MNFSALVEYCKETRLYLGDVLVFYRHLFSRKPLDELNNNLQEVISTLL